MVKTCDFVILHDIPSGMPTKQCVELGTPYQVMQTLVNPFQRESRLLISVPFCKSCNRPHTWWIRASKTAPYNNAMEEIW